MEPMGSMKLVESQSMPMIWPIDPVVAVQVRRHVWVSTTPRAWSESDWLELQVLRLLVVWLARR